MQNHTFNVAMSCGGCSGAVTRVLKKLEGVSDIQIDMEKQTVVVSGTVEHETCLKTIQKTGKAVSYVSSA